MSKIKNYNELWDFIDKAWGNEKGYIISEDLFDNLLKELNKLNKKEQDKIHEQWQGVNKEIRESKFINDLHWSKGGIINGADDSLYLDHGNWIISQGKDLVMGAFKNGAKEVKDYVKKYDLTEDEFRFENMEYIFFQ